MCSNMRECNALAVRHTSTRCTTFLRQSTDDADAVDGLSTWVTHQLMGSKGRPGGRAAGPPAATLLCCLDAIVPVINGNKAAIDPIRAGPS